MNFLMLMVALRYRYVEVWHEIRIGFYCINKDNQLIIWLLIYATKPPNSGKLA